MMLIVWDFFSNYQGLAGVAWWRLTEIPERVRGYARSAHSFFSKKWVAQGLSLYRSIAR